MPIRPAKDTRQFNMSLPGDVIDGLRSFAESRREKMVDVVVQALRRHMANPPPLPEDVPLPPLTAVPAVEPKSKKKPGKK